MMTEEDSLDINFDNRWTSDTLGPFGDIPDKKTPFQIYIFPNLLTQDGIVNRLRDDVNSSVKLKLKDNDLYKFKQSKDLRSEIPAKKLTTLLHNFVDTVNTDLRKHLEKLTGLKLSAKNFDITASRYDEGDYLLCHNDDIKDNLKGYSRTLAFVYYLNSRPWTKDDGGSLQLFDSDSTGEPIEINNSISPKPNTLIVFNTTPTSWHAVQEVFCKDDFRLSINGWFHTDGPMIVQGPQKSIEPCPFQFVRPISLDGRVEKFFKEIFNQDYLMEKTCYMIRKRFNKNSEINLTNFLVREKFNEISQALAEAVKDDENLEHVGPYNKRNYRKLKYDKLPQILKDLHDAFRSEFFFMVLSRFTGLDLVPPSIKHDGSVKNKKKKVTSQKCDGDNNSDEANGDDDDDDGDSDDEDDDDDDEETSDTSEGSDEGDSDEKDSDEESESSETEDEEIGSESIENDGIQEPPNFHEHNVKDGIKKSNPSKKAIKDFQLNIEAIKKEAEQPTTSKGEFEQQKAKKSPRKRKRTSDPLARLEYRHLEAGSYTLIHDYGYELGEKSALDVILHFNHDFSVEFDNGGYISYMDGASDDDLHDMDYELLTVEPRSNCLSLVYRCDEGTCRFLKHISKQHKASYQDLYCVYYERPDDLPKNGENAE